MCGVLGSCVYRCGLIRRVDAHVVMRCARDALSLVLSASWAVWNREGYLCTTGRATYETLACDYKSLVY